MSLPSPGVTHVLPWLAFNVCAGDLSLGPHACMVHSLPLEPSLQLVRTAVLNNDGSIHQTHGTELVAARTELAH